MVSKLVKAVNEDIFNEISYITCSYNSYRQK